MFHKLGLVHLFVRGKDKYSESFFFLKSSWEVLISYTCTSTSMNAAKEVIKVGAKLC